jgi:hypothetical protein
MKREEQSLISQQPQTQGDRTRQDADTTFYVDNYGGINVTSPTINIPYSDSPEMLNCKVSLSGTLSKRNGSFIRKSSVGTPDGTIITTFNLINNKTILIQKRGKSLDIYLLPEEHELVEATLIKTYDNVWSDYSATQKPSFVWTSEVKPRLIMTTPSNTVVELEVSQLTITGDGDTNIVVNGDYTGFWDKDYTYGIYDNNVISLSSITYSSPSTTFTFNSVIPNGQQINLFQPVWHWWAEAIKRTNDQSYASTFRFNTSVNADANVEIPPELRRGLEADSVSFGSSLAYGVKPLLVYKTNSATPTAFTFDSTPDDKDDYAFSNKVYTTGAGADYISPGTAWLTFGGIDGTGTNPPTPVHLVRQFYLPFNGGTGITCTDIQVYSSTGLKLQAKYNTTRGANSATDQFYWLHKSDMTVEITDTNSVKCISFGGGYPYGLAEAFVEIINSKVSSTVIGTSAVSTYYSPKTPGTFRPWYGASLYANFNSGTFPSVVGIYQDRLVLTGFASAPLTVLFSNSSDSGSRYYYQNFQVDFEDTLTSTNPVEIVLDGSVEDSVTNVISWYNSMFLTTRRTTRRIHGGDRVAISPTNIYQNTVGGVGCESRQGMVKTDNKVVFVSNSGLYSITIIDQSSEYTTENIGLKVKDFFNNNSVYPEKSWIFYNQLDDEIWVGLSSGNDQYILDTCLILFNQREAWSEYGLTGGIMPSISGCSNGKRSLLCIVNRDTDIDVEPSTSSQLLVTEFNLKNVLTDLTTSPTYAQMVAGYTTSSYHRRLQYIVNDSQRIISTLPNHCQTNYTNHGFRFLPLSDRNDYLSVRKYNGIFWEDLSLANNDFSLMTSNYALKILRYPYSDGDLVEISLVNDDGNKPIHVFRDNFELTQITDFTVTEDGHYNKVTLVGTGNTNNVFLVGQTIPCWHFTPTFFRQGITNLKRVVHYTGYYLNKYFQDIYDSSDVNSLSGQTDSEITDLYKVQVGVSLGILYNDARNGVYDTEVYGSDSLYWDTSTFDYARDAYRNQMNDVVRTTIPIIGVGYSFQTVNFDFSTKMFELVGYNVETRQKGKNSTRWY